MTDNKILIVSGTHGNELNPIWAVNQFKKLNKFCSEFKTLEFIVGNPLAFSKGLRYVDIDLNRSFNVAQSEFNKNFYEINRSKFLVNEYGCQSPSPCQIAIDLHTTTSSMGTSIVMYGRRDKDFCLAALLQSKFGLPIYLHEKDQNQTGFLVEAWPCGLVIEIGPVAQNHYDSIIVEKFLIILDFLKNIVNDLKHSMISLPDEITVFVHKKSIDYPRDENSKISALIHPSRNHKDWMSIQKGDPLFLDMTNQNINYELEEKTFPVFIGEAAYKEKNIAMSFTNKEVIKSSKKWIKNFFEF